MLRQLLALFGFQTKAAKRRQRQQLAYRLWYVHDMGLAEAFRSDFLDDIIRARKNVATGVTSSGIAGVSSYQG